MVAGWARGMASRRISVKKKLLVLTAAFVAAGVFATSAVAADKPKATLASCVYAGAKYSCSDPFLKGKNGIFIPPCVGKRIGTRLTIGTNTFTC